MTTSHDPTPTVAPIDALIASYVQAVEAGQVPIRQDWLERHPDHAEALLAFFADFDRMDRVASPLRLAGEIDETDVIEGSGLADPPTVRYFGDYELLEEVARGGMGIVYKARQASLNRLVALKMILAGTIASAREVARFQAKAEAAANLDHPHIVPVYEVGEYEGQQYFSMRFVEGTSLADSPREDIKTEDIGLVTVAKAVHNAHQHGVLHRDLEPSNILIDARGERYVTDFGLAKRLSDLDRTLTEAGQILGTPRYMAPEQAAGRKDLTVAADVYALGVILYERLTGQTPFTGTTALALLRQVRENEPPRLSTIRPGLDRNLKTVVLKCLQKDPTRRYLMAEALVEDLTRWQQGRPIAARPVGQAERFDRWCRRNPAIASLTASVALVLVLGIVVSTLFAYQERKARFRAEKAEDNTERAYAQSLVRPLDPNGIEHPILSVPEIEALWDLASEGTDSLKDRFLEEATGEPFTLRQLHARFEPALIATLGLDQDRRARAARQFLDRLKRPDLTTEVKVNLSFLLLVIEDGPSSANEEASKSIIQALDPDLTPHLRIALEKKIFGSCDSIALSRAAGLVLAALGRAPDYESRSSLAEALTSLLVRLEASEAAFIARTLVEAIGREADANARSHLAEALASLSVRFDSAEITREMAVRLCSGAIDESFANHLKTLISTPTLSHRNERAVRLAATVLQTGPGGTPAASLWEVTESYPCRLFSQEFVELLKMPTCFGKTRRVVLDQLGTIHGRRFANHWAFVRFAREKGLKLDFTSPPRRPEPKGSRERLLGDPAPVR